MRRRPIVVAPRRRPGLLGTMARTAVIAGTATAVSKGVSNTMNSAAQQKAQMKESQAQQKSAASVTPDEIITKLQELAKMKQAGVLTDEEFAAAKAKLLSG